MQQFYKGRTNNHLTWVMVDATDFATPESALSAATKIKIYGKVRGGTGVNFVSSGAGSLTNDIQHVGASALGVYTIALAKADLSDASNAWYDQYIISLSATGAAYQTLIVDGGIDASTILALSDAISNVMSGVTVVQSMASDAASAAVVGASRILLVQSRLSDLDSRLVSDLSDILSAATAGASRALINQSRISDVQSFLSDFQSDLISHIDTTGVHINASDMSDLRSAIAAGPAATITASDISDIASAVWAAKYTAHSGASSFGSLMSDIYSRVVVVQSAASDAASAATQANSRVLLNQSRISDVQSFLSDFQSDLLSLLTATGIQLNASMLSDLRSAITAGPTDVQLNASSLSDLRSAIAATELDASDLSDIASAVWGAKYTANSGASTFGSLFSDVYSRVVVVQSAASDAASAAQQANSRALVLQSNASDIYSLLSDLHSDLGIVSGVVSDIYSNLTAGVTISASDMSDLRSAITATELDASDLSDIASAVRTVVSSDLSDILSAATAIKAKTDLLPEAPAKNTAFTYVIKMVDATDGITPETGLTVTMTRSLDGAAFAAATGTVTEISTGHYKVAASAADMNGDVVAHRFTATGARDFTQVIQTTA